MDGHEQAAQQRPCSPRPKSPLSVSSSSTSPVAASRVQSAQDAREHSSVNSAIVTWSHETASDLLAMAMRDIGACRQQLNRHAAVTGRSNRATWAAPQSPTTQALPQEQQQQVVVNSTADIPPPQQQQRQHASGSLAVAAQQGSTEGRRTLSSAGYKRPSLPVTPLSDVLLAGNTVTTGILDVSQAAGALGHSINAAAAAANQQSAASSPASMTCLPLPPFELEEDDSH